MRNSLTTTISAALSAAALGLGLATTASAQDTGTQVVSGTVTAFDGRYDLHVRGNDGADHDVQLHQGTTIAPAGSVLRPGLMVSVTGTPAQNALGAQSITTGDRTAKAAHHTAYSESGYGGFAFSPATTWDASDR